MILMIKGHKMKNDEIENKLPNKIDEVSDLYAWVDGPVALESNWEIKKVNICYLHLNQFAYYDDTGIGRESFLY